MKLTDGQSNLLLSNQAHALDGAIDGAIDQFRCIKIQPKTIDFNTRLLGINPKNSVVIPMSLLLGSIVLA